jgi:hypothetical protein
MPIDYPPRLCVEVSPSVDAGRHAKLATDIRATVQQQCNFTPAVELVAQASIASKHKTRRLYRGYAGDFAPQIDVLYRDRS